MKLKNKAKLNIIVGLSLILVATAYWQWLPDKIFNADYSSVVLSADGQLLDARIATDEQWRFPLVTHIPQKFKQALITFEDKRFETHIGVDFIALLRAIKNNIFSSKRISGASTLTMQTIRLSRNNPSRTYWEKSKEILLAIRLELSYSKAEIFSMYATHAPFGGNVVGVEAASWRYFGRAPEQLSWAESAMLAVLPNNPSVVRLNKNRQELKYKRDQLLKKLFNNGTLSKLDLQLARDEPLPQKNRRMPNFTPHLITTLSKNKKQRFFHTTLNANLQKQLSSMVNEYSQELQQQKINHAAALVIDNSDLSVKAYIGNSQFSNRVHSGYSLDLIRRARSSGSILKPLLFATMLEQGDIISTTLVADLPTQYSGYSPQNYDRIFRGAVPAKQALAQSLNIPAVRLLKQYGVKKFYDFLKQAGISTLHRHAEGYGLPLILGGAETTLWDMAQIYANFASVIQDASQQKYMQLKILGDDKNTSERGLEIGAGSAWLTLEALLEVSRPGIENHWKKFQTSQKIAWKTGTSYGLKDGWALGVTPKWTVAVWVGNADGQGVPNLTGVGAAAPLLFSIFNQLEKSDWFETPFYDLKEVTVCKENGYLSNGLCDSEVQMIANSSHFDRITPHHIQIHVDKLTGQRVHSGCERIRNMRAEQQFILPPGQEFYYQQLHSDYKALVLFRQDCLGNIHVNEKAPIALMYPTKNVAIYIPRNLDGSLSQVVFEAVHRNNNALLYWHVDDEYVGHTTQFHQISLTLDPGWHQVVLVDDKGYRISQRFEVLNRG